MKVHFIGCNGVSMRLLFSLSESCGHIVTGSDEALGGHNKDNVKGCDLVVYTGAVKEDNVEYLEAKRLNIPLIERSEYLGMIAKDYKNVLAVAGCHGKTTVTAMLYHIFGRLNPTLHIGGRSDTFNYIGEKDYFITEACEYRRSFLSLEPTVSAVLNLELDHTDYYKDINDIKLAFKDFIDKSKTVVLNGDDANLAGFRGDKILTAGLSSANDFTASAIEKTATGSRFSVFFKKLYVGDIVINVHGRHNVYNALIAAAVGYISGIGFSDIQEALHTFSGVDRRFEFLGNKNGASVYTDYAHHPTEIEALIDSAREVTKGKVIIVFEPHTYTRTRDLFSGFVKGLSLADEVYVLPVFKSRESFGEVGGAELHNKIQKNKKCTYFDTYTELCQHLDKKVFDGDMIIFTGAGDIHNCGKMFVGKDK